MREKLIKVSTSRYIYIYIYIYIYTLQFCRNSFFAKYRALNVSLIKLILSRFSRLIESRHIYEILKCSKSLEIEIAQAKITLIRMELINDRNNFTFHFCLSIPVHSLSVSFKILFQATRFPRWKLPSPRGYFYKAILGFVKAMPGSVYVKFISRSLTSNRTLINRSACSIPI